MSVLSVTRNPRAWLLALLLIAFALRVYQLTFSGFWFDEAASYFIAIKGLRGIFDYVRPAIGEHPPVYYWLLSLWMRATGDSEFAMRFFSLWFGVLFVALFYRFARRHFGVSVARIATALSVALPYLVDYSQEARMYTLVLCLSLLAMDYFLRWARGERGAAWWYWLWLFVAIGTQYFAILLLAAQDVYVLSRRDLWRQLGKPLLILHLAVVAALGVWLFSASGASASVLRVLANPPFAGRSLEGIARTAVELIVGAVAFRTIALDEHWLAVSVWLIVLLGVLQAWRQEPQHSWLYAVLIVPPLIAAVIPYVYTVRYLFVMIPALLILLAYGVLALRSQGRALATVGVVALLLTFGYGLNLNYHFVKSPYREMVATLHDAARADDGIVQVGTGQWTLALYYLRSSWQRAYIPSSAELAELVDIDPAMRAMRQSHARLWELSSEAFSVDPANNVPRWLSLNAYPIQRDWFKNSDAVALYLTDQPLAPTPHHDVQFGEWLLLEQADLSRVTLAPGDALAIRLRWQALKAIPQSQQLLITLRLFDAQGRVEQTRVSKPCNGFCAIDDWTVGESVEDRHGLLVPRDAPAGTYSLRLEVFAPRQQQSLPIQNAQGASLELARIEVTREH